MSEWDSVSLKIEKHRDFFWVSLVEFEIVVTDAIAEKFAVAGTGAILARSLEEAIQKGVGLLEQYRARIESVVQ